MQAPLPNNEEQRINALRQYDVLDTQPEANFDELTRLAAHLCEVPIALVSLIDSDRQWFKSKVGLTATETCRDDAFCAHAILQDGLFMVPNTLADERFATNPLVTGSPKIRFYAGVPLVNPAGLSLGTLCVIDYVPRSLNEKQQEALKILARQVVTQLELRRHVKSLNQAIAERQQAEAEVLKALAKEQELNELKSRFVSMTSHEFRTPLATILLSAELLEHYSHKWTEERKTAHFQRIQTAVQQMTELMNDVLLIGTTEAQKLQCSVTPIDLAAFCHILIEEIKLSTGTQHTINFHPPSSCCPVCLDEKLLRPILSNLLINAIKYSPAESTIQFDLVYHQDEIVFQIQDQGIGIPPEDQPHLFESFHRATNVGTISGTGLGLTIVKRCVDLHAGQVVVNSEVGVGTTFTIKLPLIETR